MKSRSDDPVAEDVERERKDLRAKLGEVRVDKELLKEEIRRMEDGAPFPRRTAKCVGAGDQEVRAAGLHRLAGVM